MRTNEQYFASDSEHERERDRLGLFEELLDPLTLSRLEDLGVGPGWRCLLLGAGRGSIARRLTELVTPAGHVVATDRDVRFLEEARLPAVEIRKHDVLCDSLEAASFDLVHCRCLLMHVSEPREVLQKAADALRPGGWLLVEEPDDTASGPVNTSDPDAKSFARANRRLLETLKAEGVMDPFFGRRLDELLTAVGLAGVHSEGVTWIHRGSDVAARLMLETLELHERDGRYSQVEADATRRLLSDPEFTFVDTTWFGGRGQRL